MCSEEKKDTCCNESADSIHDNDMQKNDKLTECLDQLRDMRANYMLVSADFQNYKNRMQRERADWIRQAHADILKSLLPLADDFERALQVTPSSDAASLLLRDGLLMMQVTLHKVLTAYGVKKIEQTTSFNPELHEAISQVAMPNMVSGTIVNVVEAGYLLGDKVLRPARVVVAQ